MGQSHRMAGAPATGGSDDASLRRAFGATRDVEKRWRELLELDEAIFDQRNIRLLTPEARVLLHLRLSGPVPVTSVLPIAGTSYRGFYAVIERLKAAGLVATVMDPDDHRVRRLSLDTSSPPPSAES